MSRTKPLVIPLHRTIVGVDIAESTTRINRVKAGLRQAMYELLDRALWASGIDEPYRDPPLDRGDGALLLIHPVDHVPKTLVLGTFLPHLGLLLTEHNARHPDHAFELRTAVHAGEVHYDRRGMYGEALDLTCRLLDSMDLKSALARGSAPWIMAVSDEIYHSIVKHEYDGIDHTTFIPDITVEVAGRRHIGWIYTPIHHLGRV